MEIIFGVAVSLLVEWLKAEFKTTEWKTIGVLLAVSVVAVAIYTFLVAAGYWETIARILVTAGVFYTFVLARFKSDKKK